MYIGVDYYPEHWDRTRWAKDARLMREAGFNIVRLAEFAWVMMEPQEGVYDFDWLDEAIEVLAKEGIDVLLGTPTASMPAWLARRYPDCLRTERNGSHVLWGGRKNNCFSSGTYRLLSQRITRAMAEHYAHNRSVIGWQTDNEFGAGACYCPTCVKSFQDWLQKRYGTLGALNRAWGTHFWGQTIGDWAEIWPTGNPSVELDWKRHYSWLNVRFQNEQVAIIRELCPNDVITHNMVGTWTQIDYYDLACDLDFVSLDNYPVWRAPEIPYGSAWSGDLMRGLKSKHYWIMEQTAGSPGSDAIERNPRPGEIRKVALQQLAHGADNQLWFRWRTCTAGHEQYWHGLLGHDGLPARRYREAAQTATDMRRLESALQGTTVQAPVAVLYDYSIDWAFQVQHGYAGASYQKAIRRYQEALFRAGVGMDVVSPGADLSQYRLVLAPHLFLMPDSVAQRLDDYVKRGGVLLCDCRTGVKDETNLCHARTLPGLLRDALGMRVEEYEGINPAEPFQYRVRGRNELAGPYTATEYVDWVIPEAAETVMIYDEWHLRPYAAVTRNIHEKGRAWYVGTIMADDEFYDALLARLLTDAGLHPVLRPPLGVEAVLREGNGEHLLFLINHTEEVVDLPVPEGVSELLGGGVTGETLTLDRYGVAVLALV